MELIEIIPLVGTAVTAILALLFAVFWYDIRAGIAAARDYVKNAEALIKASVEPLLEVIGLDDLTSYDELKAQAATYIRAYLTANNLGSYDDRFAAAQMALMEHAGLSRNEAGALVAEAASVLGDAWAMLQDKPVDDATLANMRGPVGNG